MKYDDELSKDFQVETHPFFRFLRNTKPDSLILSLDFLYLDTVIQKNKIKSLLVSIQQVYLQKLFTNVVNLKMKKIQKLILRIRTRKKLLGPISE